MIGRARSTLMAIDMVEDGEHRVGDHVWTLDGEDVPSVVEHPMLAVWQPSGEGGVGVQFDGVEGPFVVVWRSGSGVDLHAGQDRDRRLGQPGSVGDTVVDAARRPCRERRPARSGWRCRAIGGSLTCDGRFSHSASNCGYRSRMTPGLRRGSSIIASAAASSPASGNGMPSTSGSMSANHTTPWGKVCANARTSGPPKEWPTSTYGPMMPAWRSASRRSETISRVVREPGAGLLQPLPARSYSTHVVRCAHRSGW